MRSTDSDGFGAAWLILAYKDSVLALAPQYQESLLAVIQQSAVLLSRNGRP